MSQTRSASSQLPSKLFFRIGEVAGLVGVEPHVLRYWEREFRSIRPTKSAKGQRVYSRKDVENLLRVKELLYRDGFTIAGAKKRLSRGPEEADELVSPPDDGATAALTDATAAEAGRSAAGPWAAGFDALESRGDAWTDGDLVAEARLVTGDLRAEPRDPSDAAGPPVRQKLEALRTEVESFLAELEDDHGGRQERDG